MLVSLNKLFSSIRRNKQPKLTESMQIFDQNQAAVFNAVAYNEINRYRCGFDIMIRRIKSCTFYINSDLWNKEMILQLITIRQGSHGRFFVDMRKTCNGRRLMYRSTYGYDKVWAESISLYTATNALLHIPTSRWASLYQWEGQLLARLYLSPTPFPGPQYLCCQRHKNSRC